MRSLVRSILGATLLAACTAPVSEGDVTPADRPVPLPELPTMPTGPLPYVARGSIAPTAIGASRATVDGHTGDRPLSEALVLATNRRTEQKVLLLGATGDEPAYLEAKTALDRMGVPYRALLGATETLTASLLTDGVATCHFSSVIVGTGGLAYTNPITKAWESSLSPGEWQLLTEFEVACKAREVDWYVYPSPDYGLNWGGTVVDSNVTTPAHQTADGKALFVRVKDAAAIPYRLGFGYRASIADAATTKSLIEADAGGVLVGTHTSADGRETLFSTVDSNPYLTHSILLEYDFVRWATRGMFVGQKRAYLSPQIDDIFLANDMWNPAAHVNSDTDPAHTEFRITGADLTALSAWQTPRKSSLPAGSSFVTAMGFNGWGTQTANYADTTLLTSVVGSSAKYTWLNHTWDHENMDAMTRTAARTEVVRNCTIARNLHLNGFDCNELITPDMSGLMNPNAVLGMLDGGAHFVVSDTSYTQALRPENPGTNPSFNVGRVNPTNPRLYQIPRHPTSIFYDVNSAATALDEYNTIYRSYYGRDLSYAEFLDKDSEFGLYYMLQGDIDPLMFHQANLARYTDATGKVRAIYADWIDAVLAKYLTYMDAPVLTLSESKIGTAMQERAKLDACGLTTTLVENAGVRSLELHTTNACTVPVTGVSSTTAGAVLVYGGEPTTSVVMAAGETRTIALP